MTLEGASQEQPFSVMDSSAVIAWFQREPGWEAVQPLLPFAIISAVNWAEVVQRLQMSDPSIDVFESVHN